MSGEDAARQNGSQVTAPFARLCVHCIAGRERRTCRQQWVIRHSQVEPDQATITLAVEYCCVNGLIEPIQIINQGLASPHRHFAAVKWLDPAGASIQKGTQTSSNLKAMQAAEGSARRRRSLWSS